MQIGDMQKKWVLAIDTALCGTNLALFSPHDGMYHTSFIPDMRGQSAHLIPHIQDLLDMAKCGFTDIGHIVAVTGPGSFTGIRVGLAAANALQLGLSCRLTGLDAFTAYRLMDPDQALAVIVDTFRDDYFMAVYADDNVEPTDMRIITEADIPQDMKVSGSGLTRMQSKTPQEVKLDWLKVLMNLNSCHSQQSRVVETTLAPFYMREADTSISRQSQWSISK